MMVTREVVAREVAAREVAAREVVMAMLEKDVEGVKRNCLSLGKFVCKGIGKRDDIPVLVAE
jgi:hypothetical protein